MRRLAPLTAVGVGAVLAALPASAAVGLTALTAPALAGATGPAAQPADLLVAGCGSLAALLLVVLAADVLRAGVQEALALRRPGSPRRRAHPAGASRPRLVRRVVALVVGLAIGSGTLAAQAAPRPPDAGWAALAPVTPGWAALVDDADTAHAVTDDVLPDPGWARFAAFDAPPAAARPAPDLPGGTRAPATSPPAEVVVHRGDSLWSLARDHLGGSADDAELALTVERLHRANVDVIGADPDVLLPGQVLRIP